MGTDASYKKRIFSENFTRLLALKGKTQREAARDLKVSRQSVSTWACGRVIPRPLRLQALADYLGVSTGYLLAEHSDVEKDHEKELYKKLDIEEGKSSEEGPRTEELTLIIGQLRRRADLRVLLRAAARLDAGQIMHVLDYIAEIEYEEDTED